MVPLQSYEEGWSVRFTGMTSGKPDSNVCLGGAASDAADSQKNAAFKSIEDLRRGLRLATSIAGRSGFKDPLSSATTLP
jgi:hypothetical protein